MFDTMMSFLRKYHRRLAKEKGKAFQEAGTCG